MILCIGTTPTLQRSLTFDRLTIDDVNRAHTVSEYASGKSINVARVLKSLGHSPFCTGFLGGPRAALIRQDLDALSIPHDFVQVLPPTRLCTTVIDRSNNTATELVEESAEVEPTAWPSLDHTIQSHGPISKVWVLSGSLPPNSPQDAYAKWTQLGLSSNATLILDTRGEPARRALDLLRATPDSRNATRCASPSFVLKLNRDELLSTLSLSPSQAQSFSPGSLSLKSAMLQATPKNGALIVTLGKDGALATDGTSFWRVTTPPIDVLSPVGSGDAFAAGLAAAFHDAAPLPDALKLAAACGAANALTDKAGHLSRPDVDRLLAGTSVQPA